MREKSSKNKQTPKPKSSKYSQNNFSKKSSNKYNSTSPARKHKTEPDRIKLRKYRTRQSLREVCDSSTSNNSFDAPSTSTGITGSNSSVFRIIEQDSDEDIPPTECAENHNGTEDNLVSILPTPLNGTHDMYINVLEMTNGNANGNVVTVRNEEYELASTSNGASRSLVHDSADCENGHASTSNRRYLQRNCDNYEEECSTTNNNYAHRKSYFDEAYEQYNDYINGDNYVNDSSYLNESDSDSDFEFDYQTPPPSKKRRSSVADSGCGSGPCSSNGSYSLRNSRSNLPCSSSFNDHSPEDDYRCATFKKRVKKAKLNIRKHVGADSDSN